jgi:thiol-disulfide isomerase/thioredoxin
MHDCKMSQRPYFLILITNFCLMPYAICLFAALHSLTKRHWIIICLYMTLIKGEASQLVSLFKLLKMKPIRFRSGRELFGHTIIACFFAAFLFYGCAKSKIGPDYLKSVLGNLEQIESAKYFSTGENWNPGDTAASNINQSFVKEYNNPSDTTIGSKFVVLNAEDTSKLEFCFDGIMRALVYDEDKMVVLDSFRLRPLPFRPISPPFFNYAKNILRYALETKDSISLDIQDLADSVFVRLTIYEETQVEFFGKAFHMPPSPYDYGNPTSIYEIWINKDDQLPYKVRREMSHNISVTSCKDVELNQIDIKDFKASDYFPDGYEIRAYRVGGKAKKEHDLIGKPAPDWNLQATDGKIVGLNDFKGKALLIQFTSVSCGPCRASIPFLNQLGTEYAKSDFELVAIESTSKNLDVLKNYQSRNGFDYPFLLSNKEVVRDYSISSYPVFFILDENHVIEKVLNGYGEGSTDEEIRKIMDEMTK